MEKPQKERGMEATSEMNYCAFCPFGLTCQQVALCDDVGTGFHMTYIIFFGVCVHSDVNFLILISVGLHCLSSPVLGYAPPFCGCPT